MEKNDTIAVLIDAENSQANLVREILSEIARYGNPAIKRAYGDWSNPHLSGWRNILNNNAIQPVQQFSYTTGKNASDSALIIDAMDLLHNMDSTGITAFAIVSSDSDFTRLATRMRESKFTVYGIGRKQTPQGFVSACNKFIYTEILTGDTEPTSKAEPQTENPSKDSPKEETAKPKRATRPTPMNQTAQKAMERSPLSLPPLSKADADLKKILCMAIDAISRDDGWAFLGRVGAFLGKNHPDFDSRNYGFSKLGPLVKTLPYLETKELANPKVPNGNEIYVRQKPQTHTEAPILDLITK